MPMPRGELRTAYDVGALGTRVEHGRRAVHRTTVLDLIVHREGPLGIALHEAQVLFDDVEVDRQVAVGQAVGAKHRSDAAVEALPARIPVVPSAEIERERTKGRPDAAVDVDFGSRAVRERDALARDADVVLQVLGDVVARLEIGGDRRLVIGLGDAAEDVVRGDAGAEGDVPRIVWRTGGATALTFMSAASA